MHRHSPREKKRRPACSNVDSRPCPLNSLNPPVIRAKFVKLWKMSAIIKIQNVQREKIWHCTNSSVNEQKQLLQGKMSNKIAPSCHICLLPNEAVLGTVSINFASPAQGLHIVWPKTDLTHAIYGQYYPAVNRSINCNQLIWDEIDMRSLFFSDGLNFHEKRTAH